MLVLILFKNSKNQILNKCKNRWCACLANHFVYNLAQNAIAFIIAIYVCMYNVYG